MKLKNIQPLVLSGSVGFLFGFFLTKSFLGGVLFASIGIFIFARKAPESKEYSLNYMHEILALLSVVLKKDGKILQSELNYIKRFLNEKFNEKDALKYLLIFRGYTKKNVSIVKICRRLDLELRMPGKRQILHLIIGAAVADRELSDGELKILYEIGTRLGMGMPTVDSLLNMYSFNYTRKKSQQSSSKSRKSYRSKSNLTSAYKVLELSENATEKQIKKAYRKLVVLYHPDKVAYMGDTFQKSAKEKFQKLQDAYENIKSARNIN